MRQDKKSFAPSAMFSEVVRQPPRMNGGRTFVVAHREYLEDVTANTGFPIVTYNLNPGLTDSFPWLGTIGASFEQYRFKKLRFIYKCRTGTNTAAQILMVTQYDSRDAQFSSKQEAYDYTGAKSFASWSDNYHDCNLKRGDYMKRYFVRTGAQPANTDIREYDVGNFSYAALAGSSLFVGELHVEYVVEFFNPKSSQASVGYMYNVGSNSFGMASPISPSGVINSYWPKAQLPVITTSGGTNTIKFVDPGLYEIKVNRNSVTSGDSKNTGILAQTAISTGSTVYEQFSSADSNLNNYALLVLMLGGGTVTIGQTAPASTSGAFDCWISTLPTEFATTLPTAMVSYDSEESRDKAMRAFPKLTWIKDAPIRRRREDEDQRAYTDEELEPGLVRIFDRKEAKRSASRDRLPK